MLTRFVLLIVWCCVALAGCQAYRAAPLDLRAHRAAWEARDPASPDVAAYARVLASAASPATNHPATTAYDPADGLSLAEAEVVALFFNPHLRAARAKARVPAVAAAEAGRWQDPVLRVDAERIIQSVEHPWVVGGVLDLTLPLSGILALERGKALAEADVARANALVEESKLIADLHAAWLELAALDERAKLTRDYLKDLDEVVQTANRLRQAGELGPVETSLFRVEQVRRTGDLRAAERQRREQEIAVKSLLGLTPEAPVRLVPDLASPAPALAAAERRTMLEQRHPRLLVAKAEYTVAERTLELEVRRQFPDLTVGGGYGRDEDTTRFLGGLSIPIPLWNANRRAIAEARANRDAARAAAQAAYEELIGGLARAEAALDAAQDRRSFLERELAPLADQQLRDARRLGKIGDASAVVLLEALTRAHEARLDVLEAVMKERQAVNQINALLRPAVGVAPVGGKETP